MANKTRKAGGDWKGFVDCPLTKEMREICIHWDSGAGNADNLLNQLCLDGYKVAFTWNEQTNSIICALTGTAKSGKNAGYTMSSHAGDVAMAIHVAAFKHYAVLQEDWNNATLNKDGADFG